MSAPITLIRALTCAFLLDTLAQAALAGLFVTGDVDLLARHDANAQTPRRPGRGTDRGRRPARRRGAGHRAWQHR
ncbi:hypothetical protein ACFP3U_33090 [Kitasatospora misakiensis]|uniref:Uncharacterized protein n=1 Tax=Kitasatospora misakiensis TaxID=67330 RepID=A0ABW0XDA4_9ACTN